MEDSSLCVPPKPGSDSQFVCKDVMREVSAERDRLLLIVIVLLFALRPGPSGSIEKQVGLD